MKSEGCVCVCGFWFMLALAFCCGFPGSGKGLGKNSMSVRVLTKIEAQTSVRDKNVSVAAGLVHNISVTIHLKVLKFIKWELNFRGAHFCSALSAATKVLDGSDSFVAQNRKKKKKKHRMSSQRRICFIPDSLSLARAARWDHLAASSSFRYLTRAASHRGRVKHLAVNWLPYLTEPLCSFYFRTGWENWWRATILFFFYSPQNKWCHFADSCDNYYIIVGKYLWHSFIFRLLEAIFVISSRICVCMAAPGFLDISPVIKARNGSS